MNCIYTLYSNGLKLAEVEGKNPETNGGASFDFEERGESKNMLDGRPSSGHQACQETAERSLHCLCHRSN